MADPTVADSSDDPFHLTAPRRRVSSSPDLPITSPRAAQMNWIHPSNLHSESYAAPAIELPKLDINIVQSSSLPSPTDVPLPPSTSTPEPKRPPTPQEPVPTWDDFPPLPSTISSSPLSIKYYWRKLRIALGYEGNVARRELVRLIWKLLWDFTQVSRIYGKYIAS